jgi:hypothetical protein
MRWYRFAIYMVLIIKIISLMLKVQDICFLKVSFVVSIVGSKYKSVRLSLIEK